jgi:hypothetical protein
MQAHKLHSKLIALKTHRTQDSSHSRLTDMPMCEAEGAPTTRRFVVSSAFGTITQYGI